MKRKNCIFLIITFLSVSIIFISCRKQSTEWKGTIEEVGGITVVKNSIEPKLGEITFELEEDLSIGNQDNDNFVFFRARDVEGDSKGNIYVLDAGNHRIQKFDINGNYLLSIGKEGEGPGDLRNPIDIFIDNKDLIYISDVGINRLSVFDSEGNFMDSCNFKENSVGKIIGVNPNGELALIMDSTSQNTDQNFMFFLYQLNIYSPNLEYISTLYELDIPIMQHFVREGKRLSLSVPFQKRICSIMDSTGNLYIGDSHKGKIMVYSLTGQCIRQIINEYDRIDITKHDIEDLVIEEFQEDENEKKFWADTVRDELKVSDCKPFFERFIFTQ
ncbi:MAG: NHL repeat-containing protein, partial [Candidatus Aminicenantes bacterium]|nr:NHL repeat-containing protein [Candidatus Aminicenantes bacterium]